MNLLRHWHLGLFQIGFIHNHSNWIQHFYLQVIPVCFSFTHKCCNSSRILYIISLYISQLYWITVMFSLVTIIFTLATLYDIYQLIDFFGLTASHLWNPIIWKQVIFSFTPAASSRDLSVWPAITAPELADAINSVLCEIQTCNRDKEPISVWALVLFTHWVTA